MALYQTITYEEIRRSDAGTLIDRLIGGEILLVRDVPEIHQTQRQVRCQVAAQTRLDGLPPIDVFFRSAENARPDSLVEICKAFRHIRDHRELSSIFAPLVQHIGGPSERLIDTGHFRCMFPAAYDAMTARADLAEILLPGRGKEPEPMLSGRALGGMPHRDLRQAHYTFQYNMWFPLQDIPREAALLLFPDAYRRPVPFYQAVDRDAPPEEWGYGTPLQPAMAAGDMLLFHSQHLHASPTQAPDLSRVTVELRVATNCQDDNGAVYRHLFWNEKNFAASEQAFPEPLRALCGVSRGTPQQIFNALFTDPEAARLAGNLRAGPQFIRRLRKLDGETWQCVADTLLDAPYTDDRTIALARVFLLANKGGLADRFAATMLEHSRSYMFLIELGTLLGRFDRFDTARQAYEAARRHASESDIETDPFGTNTPIDTEGSDILFPDTVIALCDRVLDRTGEIDATGAGINLFDYRLYGPDVEVIIVEGENGPLRLTMSFGHYLVMRQADRPDDILWCCEVEEWMSADRLPEEIVTEEDLALELCKQRYLDLPQLVHALIRQNEQLTRENETLKKALLQD